MKIKSLLLGATIVFSGAVQAQNLSTQTFNQYIHDCWNNDGSYLKVTSPNPNKAEACRPNSCDKVVETLKGFLRNDGYTDVTVASNNLKVTAQSNSLNFDPTDSSILEIPIGAYVREYTLKETPQGCAVNNLSISFKSSIEIRSPEFNVVLYCPVLAAAYKNRQTSLAQLVAEQRNILAPNNRYDMHVGRICSQILQSLDTPSVVSE